MRRRRQSRRNFLPSKAEQMKSMMHIIANSPDTEKVDAYLKDEKHWTFIARSVYNISPVRGKEIVKNYSTPQLVEKVDKLWLKFSYQNVGENDFKKYLDININNIEMVRKYNTARICKNGILTLRSVAKECDPDAYEEYLFTKTYEALKSCLRETASEWDIARVVKFMYMDQFICSDKKTKEWFIFENHRWRETQGGVELSNMISDEIAPIYEYEILEDLKQELRSLPEDDESKFIRQNLVNKIAACTKMCKDLKKTGPKMSIMSQVVDQMYDKDFYTLLDCNKRIIGMKNGIWDHDAEFHRRGFPEDYVSMSMGAEYIKEYTHEHENVKMVTKFLYQLLGTDDLVEFHLGHTSTMTIGGNQGKYLVARIGETADNGKTTLNTLDEKTFGDYYKKKPLSLITGKDADSGTATPETADLHGVRYVALDEANRNMMINETKFKVLTGGNDSIWVRPLYKKGRSIKPQLTVILTVNRMPGKGQISSDNGIWTRMVLVPFTSRFLRPELCPETKEEQERLRIYPRSSIIEDQLTFAVSAYAWLLIQASVKFKREGLVPPKAVVEKSNSFKLSNDVFAKYVNDQLEETVISKAVELKDLVMRFRGWIKVKDPTSDTQAYSEDEMCLEFTRVLDASPEGNQKCWKGWKFSKQEIKTDFSSM